MNERRTLLTVPCAIVAGAVVILTAACGARSAEPPTATSRPSQPPAAERSDASTEGPGSPAPAPQAPAVEAPAEPSNPPVVRFRSEATVVDVVIDGDSPAARDFLAMLPVTLSVEEFAAREKIAYLPRELQSSGTPGTDPEDGDLIYYVPWGNLGFYYDASGIGYSDDTLHLGRYSAAPEQLALLEGEVTVELVR